MNVRSRLSSFSEDELLRVAQLWSHPKTVEAAQEYLLLLRGLIGAFGGSYEGGDHNRSMEIERSLLYGVAECFDRNGYRSLAADIRKYGGWEGRKIIFVTTAALTIWLYGCSSRRFTREDEEAMVDHIQLTIKSSENEDLPRVTFRASAVNGESQDARTNEPERIPPRRRTRRVADRNGILCEYGGATGREPDDE